MDPDLLNDLEDIGETEDQELDALIKDSQVDFNQSLISLFPLYSSSKFTQTISEVEEKRRVFRYILLFLVMY